MNRIALAKLASINFFLDLVGEYKFKSLASIQHVLSIIQQKKVIYLSAFAVIYTQFQIYNCFHNLNLCQFSLKIKVNLSIKTFLDQISLSLCVRTVSYPSIS